MKLSQHFMMAKFAIMRTNSYIALANAGMLLFLFIQSLHTSGYIAWNPAHYLLPIYGLGCITLLVLGFIEIKLGGMKTEQALGFQLNPEWIALRQQLNRIENRLL